jgi:hypothetical protein
MHHVSRVDNRESALLRFLGNLFIKASIFFQRSAIKRNQTRKCIMDDRQGDDDKLAYTKTDDRPKRPEHYIPYPRNF